MTSATNARIAGATLLIYIAAGMASLALTQSVGGGSDIAARLAAMAQNATPMRMAVLLDLLCCFCALTLAVTFYSLTSAQDAQLAMLAMVCRLVEGVLIATSASDSLGALWLASSAGPDEGAVQLLGAFILRNEVALTSTFFAAGSFLFACLFLRGRLIPAPLAWLGVLASLLLLLVLPPQLAGFAKGPLLSAAWLPMLVFEVPLGLWLIFKGVRTALAPR